jgi:hypothetical protein
MSRSENTGLCARCGCRPIDTNASKCFCSICLEDARERVKRSQDKLKRLGLCLSCKREFQPGSSLLRCSECRDRINKARNEQRRQKRQRAEAGGPGPGPDINIDLGEESLPQEPLYLENENPGPGIEVDLAEETLPYSFFMSQHDPESMLTWSASILDLGQETKPMQSTSGTAGGRVCVACHVRVRKYPLKGLCQPCYERQRRADRKARGQCIRCGQPAVPGKVKCANHKLEDYQRLKKWRANRKELGLCMKCGGNLIADAMRTGLDLGSILSRCTACLEKERHRHQE